jgi:hypothetical protein
MSHVHKTRKKPVIIKINLLINNKLPDAFLFDVWMYINSLFFLLIVFVDKRLQYIKKKKELKAKKIYTTNRKTRTKQITLCRLVSIH